MTKQLISWFCMTIAILVSSCSSDEPNYSSRDMQKPAIVDGDVPNPIDCQQYHRGDVIRGC